ncbi:MAG: hypothetical protein FWC44_04785 [Methanomassiliicoccaceae archaeon]|nr:hypothetical protein [Methanomassiliicoccaceae archaeon]MCL2318345.1 hypothetical protein [Methanomassiliicoccaceae archaeon]
MRVFFEHSDGEYVMGGVRFREMASLKNAPITKPRVSVGEYIIPKEGLYVFVMIGDFPLEKTIYQIIPSNKVYSTAGGEYPFKKFKKDVALIIIDKPSVGIDSNTQLDMYAYLVPAGDEDVELHVAPSPGIFIIGNYYTPPRTIFCGLFDSELERDRFYNYAFQRATEDNPNVKMLVKTRVPGLCRYCDAITGGKEYCSEKCRIDTEKFLKRSSSSKKWNFIRTIGPFLLLIFAFFLAPFVFQSPIFYAVVLALGIIPGASLLLTPLYPKHMDLVGLKRIKKLQRVMAAGLFVLGACFIFIVLLFCMWLLNQASA